MCYCQKCSQIDRKKDTKKKPEIDLYLTCDLMADKDNITVPH